MIIPIPVLEALQEHIDRTTSDYLHQYRESTLACNALQQGKNLGMLQEWLNAQKRGSDGS